MAIDLVSDTVWEAVRSHLWTNLAASLSLKGCEQGNYLNLPPRDDLSDLLPLIVIEWTEATGRAFPGHSAVELVHAVKIHYLQVLSDSEVATREVSQSLQTIANIFSQPPFDGVTCIPGYTPAAGINIHSKSAPTLRVLDTFTEIELPIGHGVVELTVAIHYYDT